MFTPGVFCDREKLSRPLFQQKKKLAAFFLSPSQEPTLDPDVTRLLRIHPLHRCYKMARNMRLALALALTDDEEENHVPARLWVRDITRGRQQQGAHHHSPGASFP